MSFSFPDSELYKTGPLVDPVSPLVIRQREPSSAGSVEDQDPREAARARTTGAGRRRQVQVRPLSSSSPFLPLVLAKTCFARDRFIETDKISPPLLQLSEASFAYSKDKPILANVNIDISLDSRIGASLFSSSQFPSLV